jgi:hypothetical protein
MQEREPDDARADGNHADRDDADHDQEHRAQSDDHRGLAVHSSQAERLDEEQPQKVS